MERTNAMKVFKWVVPIFVVALSLFVTLISSVVFAQGPRMLQITATKDETFRVAGQKGDPILNLKPGEVVKLQFTTANGPEFEKDGTGHTFTIKEFKDQGWDLRLKEGKQEFTLVVPDKPGEYSVECTVKCGKGHDGMKMKVNVKS